MFSRVKDGVIVETVSDLPMVWTDDEGVVHAWSGRPPWDSMPADFGWFEVALAPRPDDTATTTWDEGPPILVDGVPTLSWVERPKTAEELAADSAVANLEATGSKLVAIDFPAMQAILNQTNAELRTDPSQEIKDMARAIRRLTRKVENLTDGSD